MTAVTGSFLKSTNTSVPVDQTVTITTGITPKVVFLWTVGATAAATTTDTYTFGFGCSTGAANSGSISAASQDAVDDSVTSSRTAAKALTIVGPGEALLAECDMKTFANGSFVITWTANNDQAYIIHYAVLGGLEVNNAQILGWNMPTTAVGTTAVTGLTGSWTPNVVLHYFAWPTSAGSSVANAHFGFGAMTAAAQWALSARANDAAATTAAIRTRLTTECIHSTSTSTAIDFSAVYASLDAGGFTVDFTGAGAGDDHYCFSLCLNLDNGTVGSFDTENTGGAGTQVIGSLGYKPGLLLFLGTDCLSATGAFDSRLCLGAGDGTNNQAVALYDQNGAAAANTWGISHTDKAIDRYSITASKTATVATGVDGYTLSWSDENGQIHFGYLSLTAYESAAVPVQLPRIVWV